MPGVDNVERAVSTLDDGRVGKVTRLVLKSEIVVPIRQDGEVIAVLDSDSADYNTFDAVDQKYLEQISL